MGKIFGGAFIFLFGMALPPLAAMFFLAVFGLYALTVVEDWHERDLRQSLKHPQSQWEYDLARQHQILGDYKRYPSRPAMRGKRWTAFALTTARFVRLGCTGKVRSRYQGRHLRATLRLYQEPRAEAKIALAGGGPLFEIPPLRSRSLLKILRRS